MVKPRGDGQLPLMHAVLCLPLYVMLNLEVQLTLHFVFRALPGNLEAPAEILELHTELRRLEWEQRLQCV